MKIRRFFFARSMASVAVAASLIMAAAAPAQGRPAIGQDTTAENMVARQQHTRERIQARLDDMARRLQIDSSQQEAWNEYTKTVQSMVGARSPKPATDADAATLIRHRATQAANHAQKLNQLADATAKLQAVLHSEQRRTLSEIVRQEGRSPDDRQKRHRQGEPYGQ